MKTKLLLSSIVLAVFTIAALACASSSDTTAPTVIDSGKDEAQIESVEPTHDAMQEHPNKNII